MNFGKVTYLIFAGLPKFIDHEEGVAPAIPSVI